MGCALSRLFVRPKCMIQMRSIFHVWLRLIARTTPSIYDSDLQQRGGLFTKQSKRIQLVRFVVVLRLLAIIGLKYESYVASNPSVRRVYMSSTSYIVSSSCLYIYIYISPQPWETAYDVISVHNIPLCDELIYFSHWFRCLGAFAALRSISFVY